MKFNEYEYIRPDYNIIKEKYLNLINDFKNSATADEQYTILKKINAITNNVDTMSQLVYIRNSINTADEFYDTEKDYMDMTSPKFYGLRIEFYKQLLNSRFKEELTDKIHPQLITLAEMEIKTFSDEAIPLMQEENKLISEYDKLISSAKIEYDGKLLNLSQMQPYMESKDRRIRKEAHEKSSNFFKENETKFDLIYDKLVKIRHQIALKLGFNNFIELAYLRNGRSDYNSTDVRNFREHVLKYIVPITNELRERQAKRIGVDEFKYYDIPLNFISGNPTPKGNKDWIMERTKKMYEELSPETHEFINIMIDRELFDLETKPNKQAGGYCTFLHDYKSPFIFANFNGTQDDVTVVTHEAGHAFQTYQSRHFDAPEYSFPTSEAAEIHSMSMEFITWPWMELFFEKDIEKFKFFHLADSLCFIPYGVTVDEFQHIVYEYPDMTPDERKKAWRDIEKKYTPYKNYDDNEFLNKGTFWFKQGHIFSSPFYYIDYTLAQICSYQFWLRFNENRKEAWEDYLKICKIGGSQSFLEILKAGNLESPFEESTINSVASKIKAYLNTIDDMKL
ncbi:MAG TPA: M3 family oligoendopeptidase [Sedimentibacter sp.]|jgi:M3 family oligoendopeptidase|nr:M3 family oligoendopeptidase [Sedimentibacter sp.]HQK53118.1 M3 family oligoendopeptidase [Sedimentibacter sp.]HQO72524.1 M3 family oligoendopeptidase [Sedimentibacter sp.]HQO94677.1 M3 family oligoendopeptidase [Sedimentibacter sp.]